MTTSSTQADPGRRKYGWLRRSHRWLGGGLAVFVLVFAGTGIALNHSDDWHLGDRYVTWSWLLTIYGIRVPAPSASFTFDEHHAVLLGQRLYFDQREIADGVDALSGLIATDELALVTSSDRAYVLTIEGDLVEQLALSPQIPGGITRLGRWQDRAVIASAESRFRSDAEMTRFDAWEPATGDNIEWSRASPLPARLLDSLQDQYRGRGLSAERLLSDIHSGRILGSMGPLFMDLVAVLLIVLSATGLVLLTRRNGRRNGRESQRD